VYPPEASAAELGAVGSRAFVGWCKPLCDGQVRDGAHRPSAADCRAPIALALARPRNPWCSYTDSGRRWANSSSSFEDRHGADPNLESLHRRRAPHRARARMPGQYPTRRAVRPRLCGNGEETDATARFYLCARCRAQVLICSCCDRGNVYCERGCAAESRRTRQRAAGQRYQRSLRGRRNHAARARRYRARQNKVTHQGSPRPPPDDVLRASAASPRAVLLQPPWRCHWCGRPCSPFVRMDFLRRGRGRDP
jgi:hypothetical protein